MTNNEAVESLIAQQEKCAHCRMFDGVGDTCSSPHWQLVLNKDGSQTFWYDYFLCGDAHHFWVKSVYFEELDRTSAPLTCLGYCRGETHE